ncbi:MAG: hypothetical protein ACXWUG_00045 [Polyangiales bacterium]
MRRFLALLAFVTPLAAASPAKADVALGTHFGAGVDFTEHRTGRFFVGWPYGFQLPGVRFTAATESGRHEIYLDSALQYTSAHTIDPDIRVPSSTQFLLFIAYQHIFDPHQSNSLFFNAGGGPVVYSGPFDAVTFMTGGGIGFRQRISGGHGTFREELRLDFIFAHKNDVPQAAILGFKFGWDLWFR